MAFAVLTTVVSAAARTPLVGFPPTGEVRATALAGVWIPDGNGEIALSVEELETFTALESPVPGLRWFDGTGFGGGKSSCETAIAMSDRKSARKKRLSIQGTGSYPPGRKG